MKAKFVGNGDADPAGISLGGVWYPMGVAVDVPPEWEAKVACSNHFVVVSTEATPEDKAALVERARALNIPADMRWSLARLRREIRAHGEDKA